MDDTKRIAFQFFNEVGIIQQLGSTIFNSHMPDGLHVSHFSILNHMVRLGDGKTPLDLAKAFQVTKGTITNTLNALLKRNLIVLQPHEKDGRSKLVFLTDEGRLFHTKAIDSLAPSIQVLDGKLDWQAVARILPELQKIRAILDENRDI